MSCFPTFRLGLNEPVENLSPYEGDRFSLPVDGMLVHSFPDGSLSIKEKTRIRFFKIGELFYQFLNENSKRLREKNPQYNNYTLGYILTCSENVLYNPDIKTIKPSATFIGGINEENFLHPENFEHDFSISTREEIYKNNEIEKIKVSKLIPFEEAQKVFNKGQTIIIFKEGDFPYKIFNQECHENIHRLSHTQNNFQTFCNNIRKDNKWERFIIDEDFVKEEAPKLGQEALEILERISVHKDWKREYDKYIAHIGHLLEIRDKILNGDKIKNIKEDRVKLPPNYTTIDNMKLRNPYSFMQKLFMSENLTFYTIVNRIMDYK